MNDSVVSNSSYRRRDFISLAGKGLGLAALSSPLITSLLKEVEAAGHHVAHLTPQQAAMDEDYWSVIQNAFTVTRGIVNLNNGGVSPSPLSSSARRRPYGSPTWIAAGGRARSGPGSTKRRKWNGVMWLM